MGNILTSTAMRNTYARLLVDIFVNIAFKIKSEVVPEQIKQDGNDYVEDSNIVLGFLIEKYIITNNEKDRVSSSELFSNFKSRNSGNKMTPAKFKEDMLTNGGITFKKMKDGNYYCGLKSREE